MRGFLAEPSAKGGGTVWKFRYHCLRAYIDKLVVIVCAPFTVKVALQVTSDTILSKHVSRGTLL